MKKNKIKPFLFVAVVWNQHGDK